MKRKIKGLLGLGLALTMAAVGVTSSFAKEETLTYTGEIDGDDLTITVTLPSDTTLNIVPYGANQVFTAADYIVAGSDLALDVSLTGYTATAVSKTAADAITFKTADPGTAGYGVSTKKEMFMTINVGTARDATTAASDAQDAADGCFKASVFGTGSIKEIVSKKSDKDYTGAANDAFTKSLSTTVITIGKSEQAPFSISGSMNPNANWEEGDKVTVVPIFKVNPNIAKTNETQTTTA